MGFGLVCASNRILMMIKQLWIGGGSIGMGCGLIGRSKGMWLGCDRVHLKFPDAGIYRQCSKRRRHGQSKC